MTATGCGQDEKSAIQGARVELSRQISVHVRNKFRTILQSTKRGALRENIEQITEKTVEVTENELVATKVAKTWRDKSRDAYCAVVVLDRGVAGSVYAKEIASALKQCNKAFELADKREREGRYTVALQNDFEALTHVQKAVKMQLAGMVVCPWRAGEFRDMLESPVLAEIKDHVRGLLDETHVLKLSGDGQKARIGYGLEKPLVVQVSGLQGKPVNNLPITFAFRKGRGSLQEGAQTDSGGKARCHVEKVEGPLRAANTILAKVDVANISGGADLSLITAPEVTFDYYLPTKSNTYFAVYVDDRMSSDAIEKTLTAGGYRLVEQSRVRELAKAQNLKSKSDETELLRAFSKLQQDIGQKGFLFVVCGTLGKATVDVTETSHGVLYIASVPHSFRLIDLGAPSERKTVLVLTGVGKEAWTGNREKAIRRARIKAGEQAGKKVLGWLGEFFSSE